MASINQTKITIGGPESPIGTAAARQAVLPIRGIATLDRKLEKAVDPAIIGLNMDAGEIAIAGNAGGGIPLTPRPCMGMGKLTKGLLGSEDTPFQVGACIRIRYTGSEESCKIVANTSGDTLASSVGDKGSESGDTNFGTAGVIDLTAAGTDTVGELVTVINAYSEYECEKVFGSDSVDAADIVALTYTQAKNKWALLFFTSTTSGVYARKQYVDNSTTERSGYSIQKDGYQDNFLYAGNVVDQLVLSAAIKAFVEGDVTLLALTEATTDGGDIASSALELEEIDPMVFSDGSTSLGAVDYEQYIKNFSLTVKNNHNPDGYGQGSKDRQYHEKGKFEALIELVIKLYASSFAERAKIEAGTLVSLQLIFKSNLISTGFYYMMIIDIPFCAVSTFDWQENSGKMDAKIALKALAPKGTLYDSPLAIWIINADSAAY